MPDLGIGDIGKELDKKGPGGIPVWGYGVALAGAVVAFEYIRGKSGGTAGATTASAGTGTSLPDTSTTTTISGGGSGWKPPWYWWLRPKPGTAPKPVPHPKTNNQWQHQADDWLIARGNDPQEVEDAVDDFLHRQPLTVKEAEHVRSAIRAWGEPPEDGPWHIIMKKGDPNQKDPKPPAHKCPKGMVWDPNVKKCIPAPGHVGPD